MRHSVRALRAGLHRVVLAALLAFAGFGAAAAATLDGVVFAVIDGDTVLFRPDSYAAASRAFLKVRLAGLDAPEADQPYGEAATRALAQRVLDRRVALETVATDAYGRTVGRVRADGVDINAELVREGHAWASSGRGRGAYRSLQDEARRERRGLWQGDGPLPPWVWRRTQSETTPPSASR